MGMKRNQWNSFFEGEGSTSNLKWQCRRLTFPTKLVKDHGMFSVFLGLQKRTRFIVVLKPLSTMNHSLFTDPFTYVWMKLVHHWPWVFGPFWDPNFSFGPRILVWRCSKFTGNDGFDGCFLKSIRLQLTSGNCWCGAHLGRARIWFQVDCSICFIFDAELRVGRPWIRARTASSMGGFKPTMFECPVECGVSIGHFALQMIF